MAGVDMTYFIRVSEPRGSFFLATYESNPITAAATESFPDIGITVHAPGFLGAFESLASGGTDAVGEGLIVPECTILQYKPPTWLADAAPSFTLVAVSADEAWRVEVIVKAQLLLMRNKLWITWIHVLRWRWYGLLRKRSEEIGRIRETGIVVEMMM